MSVPPINRRVDTTAVVGRAVAGRVGVVGPGHDVDLDKDAVVEEEVDVAQKLIVRLAPNHNNSGN
jgi:hypothetical protein